jgi:GNAT superfamily N-acetyltransferase
VRLEELTLRTEPRLEDVARVRALAAASGVFREGELGIAAELVEEALSRGAAASGYHFVMADAPGGLAGYACYGPIAGTLGSFDLYWIVVDPRLQGRGLGCWLMAAVEAAVCQAGGRRVYVDTSASPAYAPARAFYRRCGYAIAAELPDFYAPGDGKVIFMRVLG